ncbi:MAG: L-glyceraldehyde 3-phosphate reductase [Lachnotalea sp.]
MYQANENRYSGMQYKNCGTSGLKLPRVALGLWHNFGSIDSYENQKALIFKSFDLGITHFDLANNYGPIPGSAEENFGRMLKSDLASYRDEMIISSKAGYTMWPGPYGDWGSKKYLVSSLDQSLNRLGLDYVDIFYHHRPDLETPLEETMDALSQIVRSGKALYVGLSNYYDPEILKKASQILKENHTPCIIHQPKYNMFNRLIEDKILDTLDEEGIGSIAFCPLAQGLLTDKYIHGIPEGSRATKGVFLHESDITEEVIGKVVKLNEIAANRGQSLAQMALSWVLRKNRVTTVLIGASKVKQIEDNVAIVNKLDFTEDELKEIELILK